jgi:hypothetical protein
MLDVKKAELNEKKAGKTMFDRSCSRMNVILLLLHFLLFPGNIFYFDR